MATKRVVGVALLASVACAPSPAWARKPAPAGAGVAVSAPGPLDAVLDVRSPNVAFEVRARSPVELACAGRMLRIQEGAKGQLSARAVPVLAGDVPDTEVLAVPPLPAILAFSAPGGVRYGIAVRRDAVTGELVLWSVWGAPVRLGAATGYVVDYDRDGVLGTPGDGVVASGCRTIAPWCGELWGPDVAVALVATERGRAPTISALPMPRPEDADHAAGWRRLQWRRQQVAVKPLPYDASYEPGMRAHAEYMALNGGLSHDETKGKPGWSEAGAAAGFSSSLGLAPNSVAAVEWQMQTLLHRHACLKEELERSTMWFHKGFWALRVYGTEAMRTRPEIVVFPSHGMTDVSPVFGGEHPMPFPVPRGMRPGLAIGVRHNGWSGRKPSDAPTLTLAAVRSPTRTEPISAGFFAAPGRAPAGVTLFDSLGLVAFMSEAPLPGSTTFRARAVIPRPGDAPPFVYEWEFRTSAGR